MRTADGGYHQFLARRAFTLIEVLVVVAIIALLIAILLPSLNRARGQAKTVACTAQIRQLMSAAMMYTRDAKGRLPGTGINDSFTTPNLVPEFEAGTRTDWLSWAGTWTVSVPYAERDTRRYWAMVPKNGRLWRYYRDEKMLKCPAAEKYNGKLSYSTPENVSMAVKNPGGVRFGLPPIMDMVKHPAAAIQFLDEDEQFGIANYSVDDGFGSSDMFGDRHLGRATVAFFDGHAEAHFFPRGPGTKSPRPQIRHPETRSPEAFEAWMIQIAPFNCEQTPRPWKWRGQYKDLPKFKPEANYPLGPCTTKIGCP